MSSANAGHIHVVLDPDVKLRVEVMAAKQRRHKWQILQDALADYLAKHEQTPPEKIEAPRRIPGPVPNPRGRRPSTPKALQTAK